jgi:hypothetical protein
MARSNAKTLNTARMRIEIWSKTLHEPGLKPPSAEEAGFTTAQGKEVALFHSMGC